MWAIRSQARENARLLKASVEAYQLREGRRDEMKPEDFKCYGRYLLTDAGEIDRGLSTTEFRVAKIAKAILENVAPAEAVPLDNGQLAEIIKWLETYRKEDRI
jgi:hypothetical protein